MDAKGNTPQIPKEVDKGSASIRPTTPPRAPLSKNVFMITSIALGVLFALFFVGVVTASILATHGVAIPVFAFLAVKLTSITTVSSAIGSKILYGLFFGGALNVAGAIAGKIYKLGETKSMKKFLLQKIFPGRDESDLVTPLSEKKLKKYKLKKEGTIFSCQSGHNFRKLDITKEWMCGKGLLDKVKNLFTFIGHMFILDPYESFKSLFNFKKYMIYKKTLVHEKRLKEETTLESVQTLDQLFSIRIEELIRLKSISAHNQYLINPELTVLDRYIAISEAALDSNALSSDEIPTIRARIALLKEKKQEIVNSSSQADGFFAIRREEEPFYASNLLEINEQIDALRLSAEYRMQVREAVSILLTHRAATIDDINSFVNRLVRSFTREILEEPHQWKTRESTIKYAVGRYREKDLHTEAPLGETPFVVSHEHTNRSPMTVDSKTLSLKIVRSFLTDLVICLLPGAPIGAFIWTALAIALSKRIDRLNIKPVAPIRTSHTYEQVAQA